MFKAANCGFGWAVERIATSPAAPEGQREWWAGTAGYDPKGRCVLNGATIRASFAPSHLTSKSENSLSRTGPSQGHRNAEGACALDSGPRPGVPIFDMCTRGRRLFLRSLLTAPCTPLPPDSAKERPVLALSNAFLLRPGFTPTTPISSTIAPPQLPLITCRYLAYFPLLGPPSEPFHGPPTHLLSPITQNEWAQEDRR